MDFKASEQNFNTFAVPESSPQSLRQLSSPQTSTEMQHETISNTVLDDYTPSRHILNDSEEDYVTEDELLLPDPAPSGRSSISSFPASVIHHDITPSRTFSRNGMHTPSRSRAGTPTSYMPNYNSLSPISTREHITGFRNPSSVRALQMRDEFSDSEDLTPSHRRRGSRMSFMSYRAGSAHSTPGKRMSRSLQGSPIKNNSKLRKEFPLVLLHCSLLPSTINPKANSVNPELLEAIIPEPYKKRWKVLQEKIVKNFEVRERGVLIPHPKEDYDNLEERLLESLELEKPVINHGHFVGRSESRASAADSGFESEESSTRGDATDEEVEPYKCVDCGGNMCGEKRWEVKVYAANGLMKAGAWGAAWSEMEKVDVQVSVWLPEDVRREVEARLDAVIAQEQTLLEEEIQGKEEVGGDERTREIYGESTKPKKQEDIDGFGEDIKQTEDYSIPERPKHKRVNSHSRVRPAPEKIDLQHAVANYIQLLLQDRRNIVIVLLSMLLVFYGFSGQPSPISNETVARPAVESIQETKIEYLTTTIISTSTSMALETSIITETAHESASPAFDTVQIDELTGMELPGLSTASASLETFLDTAMLGQAALTELNDVFTTASSLGAVVTDVMFGTSSESPGAPEFQDLTAPDEVTQKAANDIEVPASEENDVAEGVSIAELESHTQNSTKDEL